MLQEILHLIQHEMNHFVRQQMATYAGSQELIGIAALTITLVWYLRGLVKKFYLKQTLTV